MKPKALRYARKGILMHAKSIRWILEGRKTQTRRIIKQAICFGSQEGVPLRVNGLTPLKCPYGQPGDRLYVKETWREPGSCQMPDNTIPSFMTQRDVIYRADDEVVDGPWRSSMFMPRRFSRLTLEITNIRVERVQDIEPEGCIAEGIDLDKHKCGCDFCATSLIVCPTTASSLAMEFADLWDATNGKGAWERNDGVWVVEFKKCEDSREDL